MTNYVGIFNFPSAIGLFFYFTLCLPQAKNLFRILKKKSLSTKLILHEEDCGVQILKIKIKNKYVVPISILDTKTCALVNKTK